LPPPFQYLRPGAIQSSPAQNAVQVARHAGNVFFFKAQAGQSRNARDGRKTELQPPSSLDRLRRLNTYGQFAGSKMSNVMLPCPLDPLQHRGI
jgi:hypothetical protein